MSTPIVRDAVWHDGWIEVTVSDGEYTVTTRHPLGYDGVQEKAIADFHRMVAKRAQAEAKAAAQCQGAGP